MPTNFINYLEKEETMGQIKPLPKHAWMIAKEIQTKFFMNTSIPRLLIVTMPPRSLKTTISSVLFPMYVLETFPYRTIGIQSYDERIVDSNKKRLPEILYHKINNINSGNLSPIDTFIVDDCFKSNQEAESTMISNRVFEKCMQIMLNLKINAFVLIMTSRWNKQDFIGKLFNFIKKQGINFFVDYINIPAISHQFDFLGRNPGESYWPEKYSLEILQKIKDQIDEKWFKALYQGMPVK